MALLLFSSSCGQNAHVTGNEGQDSSIPSDPNNPGGSSDNPRTTPPVANPPGTPPGGDNPPGYPPGTPPSKPPQKDPTPPQCKREYRHFHLESCGLSESENCWLAPEQEGFAFNLALPPRNQVKALVAASLRFYGRHVPEIAAEGEQLCRVGPGGGCVSVADKNPRDLDLLDLVIDGPDWLDVLYASPRLLLSTPACWKAHHAQLHVVLEVENSSCGL